MINNKKKETNQKRLLQTKKKLSNKSYMLKVCSYWLSKIQEFKMFIEITTSNLKQFTLSLKT